MFSPLAQPPYVTLLVSVYQMCLCAFSQGPNGILVNNQLDAQFLFIYVYFYSLHVSGSHVPIIRRINCINTTSAICHSENKRMD